MYMKFVFFMVNNSSFQEIFLGKKHFRNFLEEFFKGIHLVYEQQFKALLKQHKCKIYNHF